MSESKKAVKLVNSTDFLPLGKTSVFVKKMIDEAQLEYSLPTVEQRDELILKVTKYLLSDNVVTSGMERKQQWEDGWLENLNEYVETRNLKSLVPKYFDKYQVQRLNGKFIIPQCNDFEIKLVGLFQYMVFERYLKNAEAIYEFGSGTGHNLLRVREINSAASLYSMEWARSGVDLIKLVAEDLNDSKLYGTVFDNFNPNFDLSLDSNSSIYTFAALEQLGENTDNLIKYWITNKPKIVVNVEPMSEPLDDGELLQYLSIKYFEKRNYLKNYVSKLKDLESAGIIKIHDVIRTGVGNMFIEGYSIIVWSPL